MVSPLEKKCPKPNEIWNTCGTSCPEYCGEPKPQICIEMCVAGCECRKGFVKERTTGKCISRRRCGKQFYTFFGKQIVAKGKKTKF